MRQVYSVEFTSTSRKQLARLDRSAQARILKATALLAAVPRPPNARRLVSSSELWRLRLGDYRVIYAIDEERIVVSVAKVGHRSSVYRDLGQL